MKMYVSRLLAACVLLPLVALSCRKESAVQSRMGDLDVATGGLRGAILWKGEPLLDPSSNFFSPTVFGQFGNLEDWEASVDENSTYLITGVGVGEHTVSIRGIGCASVTAKEVTISAGTTATLDFDFGATTGWLTGSIAVGGRPPTPAGYWMEVHGCGFVQTDSEGRFSTLLPAGTYQASVHSSLGLSPLFNLVVAAGETTDIGLWDEQRVGNVGVVQGAVIWNGAPATPTWVSQVVGRSADGQSWTAQLDPGGNYVANANAGHYSASLLSGACGTPVASQNVTVPLNGTATANFNLSATFGRVFGSITVSGQAAPPGTQLFFYATASGPDCLQHFGTGTEADGKFSVLLPTGTYSVEIYYQGWLFGSSSVAVVAGHAVDLGVQNLQPGAVQGTVTWNGSPALQADAPFVYVQHANSQQSNVQSNGSYLAGDLPAGQYSVTVGSGECSLGTQAVTVSAGTTATANLELAANAGRVTGSLTVGGAPLPGAWVHLACGAIFVEGDGGFVSNLLPAGTHNGTVYTAAGDRILGAFTFVVVGGQATDLGVWDVPQTGAIQGSVTWNGAAIPKAASAAVGGVRPDGPPNVTWWTELDPDGQFSVTDIVPGDYSVAVSIGACDLEVATQLVTIQASATATANFDLSATLGRVVGLITVDGTPLPGTQLYLSSGPCSGVSAVSTDADGRFSLLLPPGTHGASVYVPKAPNTGGGTLGAFTFTVIAGQTAEIDGVSTPIGTDVSIGLAGGIGSVGGISLNFSMVTASGHTGLVKSGSGPPPPTGYQILGFAGQPHYWDIDSSARYSGPIEVCVHYDETWIVGDESRLRLVHDGGTGFLDISTSLDTAANTVCGVTTSLSPFALVEPFSIANTPPELNVPGNIIAEANGPGGASVGFVVSASDAEDGLLTPTCTLATGSTFPLGTTSVSCSATDGGGLSIVKSFTITVQDTTGPSWSDSPSVILAYATSTTGAKATYTLPKALDDVDGARPVTCSRGSGTTFPPGKTTVTCTAADKTGNKSTAVFTVWVQYQAPTDGMFFLKPIRPNGTSIFRIGRPVPVLFKLTGASAAITNLVAKLVVTKISNSIQGTTEDASDEAVADTDFVFKYRPALKGYAYRWKTTDQTQGTYQLKADLGDGVVHQINVSLRAAR